jgi:3-oxoacyl-[acyl-carrier protein] reductase
VGVVREIRSLGHIAEAFPGDALDEKFPDQLVTRVLAKWGKVNCLINNAGMPMSHRMLRERHANLRPGFCHDSAIHKMPDAKFDIVMKIHNYTPFRLLRALSSHWMDPAFRDMPKNIVNVSSTSGLHGAMGQINYATAKAGIVGLTKTVASEWGRSVNLNHE